MLFGGGVFAFLGGVFVLLVFFFREPARIFFGGGVVIIFGEYHTKTGNSRSGRLTGPVAEAPDVDLRRTARSLHQAKPGLASGCG